MSAHNQVTFHQLTIKCTRCPPRLRSPHELARDIPCKTEQQSAKKDSMPHPATLTDINNVMGAKQHGLNPLVT